MLAQQTELPIQHGIRRREHPAVAGREQLAGMERKTGDLAMRPADALPPAVPENLAASRTRGVLDERQAARQGERHERRQVAGHAELVHAENRLGTGRDRAPRRGWDRYSKVSSSTSTKTGVAPQYRMALAVATKEWLTVTTSSPGSTPNASSARCSAVVQLDTAQAWAAPTAAANSCSKAATSGPCVTQPERIARRAASASRSSIHGRATGIMGSG